MHLSHSITTFLKMTLSQRIIRDEDEGISKPAIFSLDGKRDL